MEEQEDVIIKRRLPKGELKERLYRRRYLVPNAVTVGSMFCGFLTIIYASSMRWDKAAVAILLAILLDGLDGRVARKLNATSQFGLEFDSLSDLVSFGIAPAMLMYHWCYKELADEFGVAVCFIYALCAASRLARFNITVPNLTGFQGLPSPAAAGMVAASVFFMPHLEANYFTVVVCSFILLGVGYLMVCKINFSSIKKIKVENIRLRARITIGALMALVWYQPRIGFLVLAAGYCLSGPLIEYWRKRRVDPAAPVDETPGKISVVK